MANIDAFIDYSDNHVSVSLRRVPCLRRANLRDTIKLSEARIIRRCCVGKEKVIGFGVEYSRLLSKSLNRFQCVFRRHSSDSQSADYLRSLKTLQVNHHG